jgi:D-alanyl-lipoteichoic acid acyltransferase DltB (MBOAT superfamily)
MLFNSVSFLFYFLPTALVLTWAISRWTRAGAKAVLVVLSLAFYGFGAPRQVPLLVASFAFNYLVAVAIHRARAAERPRWVTAWLTAGVLVDLGLLLYFKYSRFVVFNIAALTGAHISLSKVVLPLAISFFTFQEIAYLVDTARGETRPMRVLDYALFMGFFPKLISGPIVRYGEMGPQLEGSDAGSVSSPNLLVGLVMFSLGLFKKTVIADSIAPYAGQLFGAGPGHPLAPAFAWIAAICFTLQLYFDFSGYSDMAIGLARMFGIRLPLNFHSPLRAASIMDFWRRWHMTLQRWVVTYIFQPLSLPMNRMAAHRGLSGWGAFFAATGFPIFFTFLVLGIWHGAGWTFVVFGVLHGLYVSINEAWREHEKRVRRKLRRAGRTPSPPSRARIVGYHALTLAAVLVANIVFRSANLTDALRMWRSMAGLAGWTGGFAPRPTFGVELVLAAAITIVFLFPNTQQILSRFEPAWNWQEWKDVGKPPISWTWKPSIPALLFVGAVLFFAVMFVQNGPATFVYFNF